MTPRIGAVVRGVNGEEPRLRARPSLLPAVALLGLFGPLGALPAWSLNPHLLKDINAVPFAQGSSPNAFARAGGLAYFAADDGEAGSELWRSDGTAAGTFRLADACPGECSGRPVVVARSERLAFFRAFPRNGFGPVDLWATDGTPEGTLRLAGPLLLPDSPRRTLWVAGQGVLYFAANDLAGGAELWRSDGTPAGTFEVADLRPGFAGSEPAELTELDGRPYFRADDGVHGPALWMSDGTAEGTRLVLDPLPRSQTHSGPDLLRRVGGALTFVAPVSRNRIGLWRSDGTAEGTAPFLDLPGTVQASVFPDATVLGDRLLFVAFQAGTGRELWVSDGTRRGTLPLTRFAPASPFLPLGSSNSRLLPERSLGGTMVFRADDGVHGAEPWVTDGTAEGTRLLADLCPGPCLGTRSVDDAGLAAVASGNLLFFPGGAGARGEELWATDGTPEGTRLVRDLCRGGCSSEPSAMQVGEGAVYFLARNGQGVAQLWRSDGTPPGTLRLTSFPSPTAFAGPSLGIPLGRAFLFGAADEGHGRELWRSDGTPASTRLLADLNRADFGGSFPTAFRTASGRSWFFANDGLHGFELWSSDGTEGGTALVHEFTPGPEPARAPQVAGAVEKGGRLYLLLDLAGEGFSLWASDGSPGGTARLSPPELRLVATEPLRLASGRIFFVASDDAGGEELWSTDGSAGGTLRVADLAPGAASSEPRSLTVYHERLFFTAFVEELGRELWRSDGSAGGTVLVKDIDPRPGVGAEPALLTVHQDRLFFPANDPEHGIELWSSDGTEPGTRLDAEVVPGPVGVFMTHLISAGPHLYFSGGPPSQALRGLWVSDGTSAGTKQIGPLMINVDRGASTQVGVFEDQIFFASQGDQVTWRSDGTEEGTGPLLTEDGNGMDEPQAYQAFAGRMLFTAAGLLFESDGTQAGTRPVLEVTEPPGTGVEVVPFELGLASGRLLFRSWERLTGSELWALEEE